MPMSQRIVNLTSPSQLEKALVSSIEKKAVSYFLFCSPWDSVSKHVTQSLADSTVEDQPVYLIDTFEIPQALTVFKSVIAKAKPTMNLSSLKYSKVPQMIVMHKAFPRLVDYNGAIYAELGL